MYLEGGRGGRERGGQGGFSYLFLPVPPPPPPPLLSGSLSLCHSYSNILCNVAKFSSIFPVPAGTLGIPLPTLSPIASSSSPTPFSPRLVSCSLRVINKVWCAEVLLLPRLCWIVVHYRLLFVILSGCPDNFLVQALAGVICVVFFSKMPLSTQVHNWVAAYCLPGVTL